MTQYSDRKQTVLRSECKVGTFHGPMHQFTQIIDVERKQWPISNPLHLEICHFPCSDAMFTPVRSTRCFSKSLNNKDN